MTVLVTSENQSNAWKCHSTLPTFEWLYMTIWEGLVNTKKGECASFVFTNCPVSFKWIIMEALRSISNKKPRERSTNLISKSGNCAQVCVKPVKLNKKVMMNRNFIVLISANSSKKHPLLRLFFGKVSFRLIDWLIDWQFDWLS